MESTNVESQESLLHDQTQTSSELKQEASLPETPVPPSDTGCKRPYRDSIFTFFFLTAIITTFTFGIIASTRTDTLNMDTKLRLSKYNPTTTKCEITQQQTAKDSGSDPDSDFAFVTLAAIASLCALALTIPLSLLLVSLLRRYPRSLLVLSAPVLSLVPLGLGLLFFSWCLRVSEVYATGLPVSQQIFYAVLFPGVSALRVYELWKNWTGSAVDNGVEVLRMATGFWKEHFVLLVVNPLLLMGWMVVVNGPIFLFMWYAFNVGEIAPDFDVVNDPNKGCDLATGSSCCRAERPGWVYAYITFASFTAFWVLMVSMVLQNLVVSVTVSLWYFAPTGSSAIGNIKRSLRNAYGTSFGTACNLGTIVTTLALALVTFLKKISDRVLMSRHRGMMPNILHRCFSRMSQFPECNHELASTFAGILGLSFWESSKMSHNPLLLRTFLISTARVNLTLLALIGMTFICTLVQTLVVYGVLEYFSNAFFLKKFLIVLICFFITMIGLGEGFAQPVSSVITTVSAFYAMQKIVGKISRPEVCHAFMITAPSLPENGGKDEEPVSGI